MDAIEAIKSRRTIRQYQEAAVTREVLTDLVDCGRLAPTAMNDQPWEFVVVTNAPTRQAVAKIIGHAPQVAQAPALIAVLCKPTTYYVEDGCAATMNILISAQAHGLGACWVCGEKQPYADDVCRALGAPSGLKLISVITVGVAAEAPIVEKRSLASLMHFEKF